MEDFSDRQFTIRFKSSRNKAETSHHQAKRGGTMKSHKEMWLSKTNKIQRDEGLSWIRRASQITHKYPRDKCSSAQALGARQSASPICCRDRSDTSLFLVNDFHRFIKKYIIYYINL